MPRNFSRLAILVGAALFAGAPVLHAQQTGAPVRGDVDGDGRITAADARIVSDFLVGKAVPAGANVRERGDVNGDGRVTAVDAAIIARAAAGRDVSRFPVGKPAADDPNALAKLVCEANIGAGTLRCDDPRRPTTPDGMNALVLPGPNGEHIQINWNDLVVTKVPGDTTYSFDVTLENRIPQSIGTIDNVTPAADSIQLFLYVEPVPTGPSNGIIDVSADTTLTPYGQRHFVQFSGPLAPGDTTGERRFHFEIHGFVNTFKFELMAQAAVQFPNGWVDIYRPDIPQHDPSPYITYADTLLVNGLVGETVALVDSVRNAHGKVPPGAQSVNWAPASDPVAEVSPAGVVTAKAVGTRLITATTTSADRSGQFNIVVTTTSVDSTTITAQHATRTAGDSTLITVQVKDQFGRNVGVGSPYVPPITLATTLGTLRGTAGAGTTGVTPVDVGNGTYTAWLKSTTSGTATVTGKINGVNIVDNAVVTFNAAAPANIVATSATPQNGTVGAVVSSVPTVLVTDQFGNAVGAGVPVKFKVTGGGGKLNSGPPLDSVVVNTNGSGNAAVTSWTLGGTAPGPNALSAALTTPTPPSTSFTAYVQPLIVTDSSQVMGNTKLDSAVVTSVLANDVGLNGAPLVITTTGNLNTARPGGVVFLSPSGKFTYTPPAGNVLVDSVEYIVSDGHRVDSAYVRLRYVGKVWYVDGSGANGDGRDISPFNSIANAELSASVNDSILVRNSTVAGGTLKNVQLVFGQNPTTAFMTALNSPTPNVTLLPMGTRPNIGALILGSGNTLQHFTSTGGITGSGFVTLSVSDVGINNPSGQALSLTNGMLSGGFTALISGGGTNNVLLSNVSSGIGVDSLGVSGNALSGATGDAVVITGGSGSFYIPGNVSNGASFAVNVNGKSGGTVTFAGNINPGGAARGISAANNTGGSIVFSGGTKAINSGSAPGVTLINNAGASISFTGGGLTIATTDSVSFRATGGGTVQVSVDGGSNNTILATGAAPNVVNLNGITLGSGGMNFSSITSNGTTTGSAFSATSVGNTSGSSFSAGSLTVAGAGSRGIDLTSNSAPFTFGGGSVAGTTGDALFVSGGSANITVAANLGKTTAGRIANIASHTAGNVAVQGTLSCTGTCTGINVASNSGGTIDFSAGTKTLTGANAGVTLSSNTGATVKFSSGGLAINTTAGSGAGFSATGGGTVTVEGSNNTISTATGTALNVSSTTIGANGLTFKSITAAGAGNGIVLSSTGSNGGLTVTGDGLTNGSGGSITNSVGGDGATAGNGVYLNSAQKINLSWMSFSGNQNNGVYGTGVRGGFTMDHVRFTGLANGSGASGAFNESDVQLVNIGGAVKLTNSRFDGAGYNAVRIENITGTAPTLDSLVIAFDTVSTMQGSTADVRGTALLVNLMDGTADTRIRNNQVTAWWGNGIHVLVQGTASGTTRITNNFVDNTNGALAGAGGIWLTGGSHAFNISGNTVRHTNGAAISADRVAAGSNMNGTIDNNAIGVSGDNNSGSSAGAGIFASHHGPGTTTTKISNNTIRQVTGQAAGVIWVLTGDATGFGGSGTFNATVVGNDMQETGSPSLSAHMGILATVGTQSGPPNDTDQVCLDIGGSTAALRNSITNINTTFGFPATSTNRIRVNQRFGTTSRFPGYTGAQLGVTSQNDLATYLLGRNTASNSTNANTSTGGYNNTSPAGSACPQPTM
jgi:hypothetical protein